MESHTEGFWYHREEGFYPYVKGVIEEKHHEDAIFVSIEFHTNLFNKHGKGYKIVHPSVDGELPWLEEDRADNSTVESNEKEIVRSERNVLLKETDWTQLPDIPEETRNKFKKYRQCLRDIPQQEGFPFTIQWPRHPNEEKQCQHY